MILEPKENALRMKKKVECWPDKIPDARYPEKVKRRSDRIPDMKYSGGMSYAMCGGLRTMKINGNRSGVMDGDVGMLDKTINNK